MSIRHRLLFHAWLQTLLWIAVLVVANHAGSAAFFRVDVTGDHRFSLSDTARRSVSRLDRPLIAQVWFTADLDAPYHNHLDALRDKLEALRAWSGGQMELEIVDPTGDKDAIGHARALGISPVTYTRKDWDRQEARQVFMGVSLVYGERQAAIGALPSIERMEYELVRAIRAVTTEPEDRRHIAWSSGNAEPDLTSFPANNPIGKLREELGRTYELTTLSLTSEPVPEEVDVLLMVGPQLPVPDLARFHLDQFVMRGGAVAFFLAGAQPDFRALTIQEVRHDLHALVGHWGVRLNRDVVLDRKHNEAMVAPVQVGGRQTLARVNYPLAVVTRHIDRIYGPIRELERAVLPFTTTLTLSDPLPAGVDAEVWIRTGPTSVSARGLRTLRADLLTTPGAAEVPGPFPAVVGLSGRFPSYYADRGVPTAPDGPTLRPDEILDESRPTRLVVAASADMVANNLPLVLNSVDWLLEDPSLISVRARSTDQAGLPAPPRDRAWRLRAAIGGLPMALLALSALLVWARTRRSQL